MKTKLFVIAIAGTALGITALPGAEEETGALRTEQPPQHRDRAAFIERFDTDGDGKLSAEERDAARAAMEQRRSEGRRRDRADMGNRPGGRMFMERFDKDGDGRLSEEERAEARKFREEMTAKFDADGDGKLSREEMRAAREAMGGPGEKPAAGRNREDFIARFDEDGDGKLSPEELDKARAAMAERRARRAPPAETAP